MSAMIWVIDDEESVRDVVGAMLRELGYEVRLFADGEEAIKAYREKPADIVITDVRMPGMSGLEVTRRIIEIDPDGVVMILTGFPSIADAVEAIKSGAVDFLSKPCRIEEMRVRIERALESREMQSRLHRTRLLAWILIATLPIWFILGVLLARLLQS